MISRRHPSRAFTLLELILVMAIMAIAAAMVAPRLRGFAMGRRTQFAGEQIVAAAHDARTQAISEGRIYHLNFDVSARQFWLTADDGSGTFQPVANDEFGQPMQLADGIAMQLTNMPQQPDGQYVSFQPSGRTDPGHIHLSDTVGGSVEIACDSATELYHVVVPGGT